MEDGKAVGIQSGEKKAFAKTIIADPSYFSRIHGGTKVVRAICLLNHAPSKPKSKDLNSANIIILQTEVGRSHDIYIGFTSGMRKVFPND